MINYSIAAFIAIASSTVASADEIKHLAKHFRGSVVRDNVSSGRRRNLSPIKVEVDTTCYEEIHHGRCINVCTEVTSTHHQVRVVRHLIMVRQVRGGSRPRVTVAMIDQTGVVVAVMMD